MDKPTRVLKVLEDNGFDWWELKTTCDKIRFFKESKTIAFETVGRKTTEGIQIFNAEHKSLADLATSRSALEAGSLMRTGKYLDYNRSYFIKELQKKLIHDITYNNGDKFWDIWFDFLGLEE